MGDAFTSGSARPDPDCTICGGTGILREVDHGDGTALVETCPRCHVPPPVTQPWHVISSEDLLAMLRRCHAGEDPDLVYIEEYANADRQEGTDER